MTGLDSERVREPGTAAGGSTKALRGILAIAERAELTASNEQCREPLERVVPTGSWSGVSRIYSYRSVFLASVVELISQ
jgi:hypothetical protein